MSYPFRPSDCQNADGDERQTGETDKGVFKAAGIEDEACGLPDAGGAEGGEDQKRDFVQKTGRHFASEKETCHQTDKIGQDQSCSAAGEDGDRVGKVVLRVGGRQRDGGELRLIPQLPEKEGSENSRDRAETALAAFRFPRLLLPSAPNRRTRKRQLPRPA